MTSIPFVQVDAFADRPFGGNPAAVMLLDEWLPDAVLQSIATENNLSETAFMIPDRSGDADRELRWFTPAVEVALCGHATLASGHVLLAEAAEGAEVRLRTRRAGTLRVRKDATGYRLDLPAWPASPSPQSGIAAEMGGHPVETLWRDGGYCVLVYPQARDVRALKPDFSRLGARGNILFIATAPGGDSDVISRVFAPGAGIDEDPVTGSAHAVIAPYWAERLARSRFSAYQASARGGRLDCEYSGDRVILGGHCVTVIEGRFTLP